MCDCIQIQQTVRKYEVTFQIGSDPQKTVELLSRGVYNGFDWFRFYKTTSDPVSIWYDVGTQEWRIEQGATPGSTGTYLATYTLATLGIAPTGSIGVGEWENIVDFNVLTTNWFVEEVFTIQANALGTYNGENYFQWDLQTVDDELFSEDNKVTYYLYYDPAFGGGAGGWYISTALGDSSNGIGEVAGPTGCPPYVGTPPWFHRTIGYVGTVTSASTSCGEYPINNATCSCINVSATKVDSTIKNVELQVAGVKNGYGYWQDTIDGLQSYIFYSNGVWLLEVNGRIIGSIETVGCPLGDFDITDNNAILKLNVSECDTDEKTITYSVSSGGWSSFWSYRPDWMVEMNNVLYTFKDGSMWRHHNNETRNNYYGVQYTSRIKTIFNANPTENKMFASVSLNSNYAWSADIETNIQFSDVPYTYFVEKESIWYAYIRRQDNTVEVKALSTQGIGQVDSFTTPTATSCELTFTFNIDTTAVSVGDKLYKNSSGTLFFLGDITAITATTITIDTTYGDVPTANDFIICAKNSQTESYGVRGFYMTIELENGDTEEVELFSIATTTFKSFQ
jgi:hypothetical protein